MTQAAERIDNDIIGLFELDNSGTVLYRRPVENNVLLGCSEPQAVGKDFFQDVVSFQNRDDLKRYFKRFVTSDRSVDNFIFDCLCNDETIKTRISMTRGSESGSDRNANIVILEIKRAKAS